MKVYTINIKLLSDALINSGQGFGAIIDSDVVFDDIGIPYIPAKRIKGCLRDAAEKTCNMLNLAGINFLNNSTINSVFGIRGGASPAPVYFSNLVIDDYENNKLWLEYLRGKQTDILSRESIMSTFSTLRQQTRIDESGIADEHSLRTIRVLSKWILFKGEVQLFGDETEVAKLLSLACLNLRHIGTKRNRGFGEVECKLYDGRAEVSIFSELESLCKK